MKKKQANGLKIGIAAACIAVLVVVGYFVIFHNADVLKVENGKIASAKATWLIGRFSVANGEEQYYKLADVSAPRNYSQVKDVQDTDNDPLTTFFVYQGKDAQQNPATFTIQPALRTEEISAKISQAISSGWGPMTIGEKEVCLYPVFNQEANAYTSLVCLVPSPYEGVDIQALITMPNAISHDEWLALCETIVNKITPGKQLSSFAADFKLNFIDDNRWEYLWNGLGVTLQITLFAVLLGIVIGVVVATVRSTWDKTHETLRPGLGKALLTLLDKICRVYLTVIRGTPVVIQLMIMYYIIFAFSRDGVMIAILAFGINSGAYVAEIIRGGIMSIDNGQFEAGRSLGFNYVHTMWHIIIPQALKNVLPSLANEFIVLLKETSVAGYVAVKDLTKGGDIIRGVTYSAFMPLLAVAAIYLVLVMFFTWLVGKLERRLRNSDH